MKRLFFAILLVLLINVSAFAYKISYGNADVCYQNDKGTKLTCHSGTVPSIRYSGDVILNGTTVTGNTRVSGDLDANAATLNTVSVSGNTDFSKTIVNGRTHISGDVKITDNSQFKSDLDISGDMTAHDSNFNFVEVHGDFLSSNSNFNQFEIHGDTNVTSCKFLSDGEITGDLNATNSNFLKTVIIKGDVYADHTVFQDELDISAVKAVFKHSNTKNIINTANNMRVRNIYLQNQTVISGSVIFKYGDVQRNIVHKVASSNISGQVIHGKLVDY